MARTSAAGDPARSLGLLWGPHTRPGRSGLTVAAIVAAATALADAEGLGAVSMRRVAERLGVGAMSLYTHVVSHADLVQVMVDTAAGTVYADVDEPSRAPGGWRGALEFVARRNWELYQRHPWLLDVAGARPVLGPHTSLKYEAELRPLDGVGLTDVEMDSVLTLVLGHVDGTARALAGVTRTREETGMTDEEWWRAYGPALSTVMDPARFPVAGRVGSASSQQYNAAQDPVHALDFGLRCILDGVAALIAGRP
ncbi:MAG TPA: TetR/AcrR family transcriptional regulator [Pseudonocardiaceae bacterium]